MVCREVDSEGVATFNNLRSGSPSAFDTWDRLDLTTTLSPACETLRLVLRVTDRLYPQVVYWDDVSFRSDL